MNLLLEVALKHLSESHCSERELRLRLESEFMSLKNGNKKIELVVTYLKDQGLLNDQRIAESFLDRYAHKGNHFIRHFLGKKGIPTETITQALEKAGSESDRAFIEAKKKLPNVYHVCPKVVETSLFRFLSGRGFSHESLNLAISRLKEEGNFDNSPSRRSMFPR